ncbi:DUF692 domain-containing protein [Ferrimonas marina]|nr:DUF692 domain-containing protein [Ferrimonas marina]
MKLTCASISLREPHMAELLARELPLPYLEVMADNFLSGRGPHYHLLKQLAERYPIELHCVGFSFGSTLDPDYLKAIARLAVDLNARSVSDHLSLSAVPGGFVHDLLPVTYQESSLQVLCDNLGRTQEVLSQPLRLENPSRYLSYQADCLTEGEMMTELHRRCGIEVLLDINNLYVTGHNLGIEPEALMADYPAAAVRQYHLAGHAQQPPLLLDNHGNTVSEPVWQLYQQALESFGVHPTVIEWDDDLPALDTLLGEARQAERFATRQGDRTEIGGMDRASGIG